MFVSACMCVCACQSMCVFASYLDMLEQSSCTLPFNAFVMFGYLSVTSVGKGNSPHFAYILGSKN